ncbi:hypothetical protein ACP4OV_022088 [Aristida adscensionis]
MAAAANGQGAGKRGRESSSSRPTTEAWRELARTVPGTLLLVATTGSDRALGCVDSSRRRLVATDVTDVLRLGQGGHPRPRRPAGLSITSSHGVVARLVGLHAAAGHLFALCAARLGLLPRGDARWRAWEGRRAEAARHAGDALRRLRSAWTDLAAVAQVLLVLQGRPPGSPPRAAWTSEAQQLVRHAAGEVAAAWDALRRMRDAVVLEFFDAWAVLTSR